MKRKEALKLQATEREPSKGWPPSLSISPIVHLMEYYVPRRGFHVGPHILIQAYPWAAVVASYLQNFPNVEVVGEPLFVFAVHGGDLAKKTSFFLQYSNPPL